MFFPLGPSDLGRTGIVQHETLTEDCRPIRQRPHRLPQSLKSVVQKQVQDMLSESIIKPSISPWSSPVVLVKKHDGSYRFCVDYRALNRVTVKDAYPLPRVNETLDCLGGSKYFATLDLASEYWQVEVNPSDRPKTAFKTPQRHFQFNVMPFGLCNAPATFQRLMEYILAELQWKHCLIYLDDIIAFSQEFQEQMSRLEEVFTKLRKAGLKLKPKKCCFAKPSVRYLSHVVSQQGLQPDSEKARAVGGYPRPMSTAEVRSSLGLVEYYRRFIKGFSTIAVPLTSLQQQMVPFEWTVECEKAFNTIKESLTTAPVLVFPKFTQGFVLATDASDRGLGAVLSQVYDGKETAIAYVSRVLRKAETNFSTIEKEALALVWTVGHFQPYLLGRPFTLITAHCPLKNHVAALHVGCCFE